MKTKKGVKEKLGLVKKGLRKELELRVSLGSKKHRGDGKIIADCDEIEVFGTMNSLTGGKIEINLTNNHRTGTSHLNMESVESLNGTMVNGIGRQSQVDHSSPSENVPLLGADDCRKNMSRSPPPRREGPINGMVHSIVTG
ncbi:hypothetical protein Pint_15641 [Pistacia integerrima]|uniref:Uncharacterized protein n=1 Tax=Pistacia integerrima TaxID=434235 RepID=A0ACC0ZFC7_9ROSI|nr:hypothetical protein Pint_15641 [Pistacia integerrima]